MDHERVLLVTSIISILPCWVMIRTTVEIVGEDKMRTLRSFLMFFGCIVSCSFVLFPLFTFCVYGKVF